MHRKFLKQGTLYSKYSILVDRQMVYSFQWPYLLDIRVKENITIIFHKFLGSLKDFRGLARG